MKKFLRILVLLVILGVALLLLFGDRFGLGFGTGLGFGQAADSSERSGSTESDASGSGDSVRGMETDPADLPDTITVTIREDKVYVEDKEIADADALKSYIETINTDDRKYKLVDDNSIRATYEWVTGVFDELKIPLSEE
ncbi:MAG: hypothetical protein II154_01055 [Lachnospiraceae bacterium]|nr:hypothetical protein [Lachnospiraceae bacterium]